MATKILIVDDDALLRRSLKYQLEHEGYTVVAAADGQEALTAARADRMDLILLDIGLPDGSGLDVARALQRESPTPVIFLSARGQETDIVVGLELGAEDYITKPFGMRELIARIRVVLRRMESSPVAAVDVPLIVGEITLDPRAHTGESWSGALDQLSAGRGLGQGICRGSPSALCAHGLAARAH